MEVSDCGEDYIDLLIRKVGKVTNKLFELNVGDCVWMRGVHGNGYPINDYNGKHLIVIAGGTGVAPVKGLIQHFSEQPKLLSGMDAILGFRNQNAVLYRQWAELLITLNS